MTRDVKQIWEQYTSSWKAGTLEEKRALFELSLSPRVVYADPLIRAEGFEALAAYMADFHRQIPGGHFVTSYFLAHHDCSIARWTMCDGEGKPLSEGISYGQYGSDGKLVAMTGFFETPNTP